MRGRTDLVIVAELLGHARLETTRGYSRCRDPVLEKRLQPALIKLGEEGADVRVRL